MGNIKILISKFLFPVILILISLLFLIVGISPGKTQSGYFLLAGAALFVTGVLMVLLSAGIIKGRTATILGLLFVPVALYLGYANYKTINDDILYAKLTDSRYNAVRARLEKIREAQIAFKSEKGKYCGNFDELIKFLKTDSVKRVMKIGDDEDTLAMLSHDKTRWSRDTVYMPVLGTAFEPANYPVDSLKYIPNGNGALFNLAAGFIGSEDQEIRPPVFEAFAKFETFLKDLSEKYGKTFPDSAIRVGSMIEPTTNGNWK